MDARPQTPRLTNRRDAMGNVLDIVNDDLIGKFHEIHQRLHGDEADETTTTRNSNSGTATTNSTKSNTTTTTPRQQLVEDRSVLRSPRFHSRRNALDDPTSAAALKNDRALCSRFRQLELMTQHTATAR